MTISSYGPKTPEGLDATSVVSIQNSSTTPLGSSGTFTGPWEDVSGYDSVTAVILTDASGTLQVQFSPDGTNIDSIVSSVITGGSGELRRLTALHKYYRIVVINDVVAQTYMRLQSLKGLKNITTSTLNASVQNDADCMLVRNISDELLIVEEKYSERYIVNQFGKNSNIDTGTLPEDIWDMGGVYTGFPTGSAETLTITSTSANDTNSGGTGARTLRIFGLDANKNLQQEDINLTGTVGAVTLNTYSRVFRSLVLTAGSSAINEGHITITHTTTTSNIFAGIRAQTGETRISAYTIPTGYTGYLKRYSSYLFDSTANRAELSLWYREENGAVLLKNPFVIRDSNGVIEKPYGGVVIPEKTDIIFRCTLVDSDNADITVYYDLLVVKN